MFYQVAVGLLPMNFSHQKFWNALHFLNLTFYHLNRKWNLGFCLNTTAIAWTTLVGTTYLFVTSSKNGPIVPTGFVAVTH